MFANEVLHAKPKDKIYYYEVMSVFTESHPTGGSRLLIELIPLNQVTPATPRNIVSRYPKLRQSLTFDLSLDHHLKSARFATKRDVLFPDDFRSCGLGTYVFSKLIEWGQKHATEYHFQKLSLSSVDAETEEDKKRRNDFYESFGFELDFSDDPEKKCGSCKSKLLSSLNVKKINQSKIMKFVALDDLFTEMADRNDKLGKVLAEKEQNISNLTKQRDTLSTAKDRLFKLCFVLGISTVLLLYLLVHK
jgi:hypothetical protein